MDEPVFSDARQIGLRTATRRPACRRAKLIVRQCMWLAAIGSLTGALLLKSFQYGVSASDPIAFTGIAFTLLTIAFLACRIPARRAGKKEPSHCRNRRLTL